MKQKTSLSLADKTYEAVVGDATKIHSYKNIIDFSQIEEKTHQKLIFLDQ